MIEAPVKDQLVASCGSDCGCKTVSMSFICDDDMQQQIDVDLVDKNKLKYNPCGWSITRDCETGKETVSRS